jgi:ParB family chromosome partitioning protein
LLENLPRLHPGSLELMREIGALKNRGYTNTDIAAEIDFTPRLHRRDLLSARARQERLLPDVERGVMPADIGMGLSAPRSRCSAACQALREQISAGNQTWHSADHSAAQSAAKEPSADRARRPQHREITATALTQSYETEAQRQKLLIEVADPPQTRLTFIVDAPFAVLRVGHRTLSRRDPSRRRERGNS